MIYTIYYIIITYFLLAAIGFYFINKNKTSDIAKKSWIKYGSYFIIINLLFFSIVINSIVFRYFSLLIIVVAIIELLVLFVQARYAKKKFFLLSLIVFAASSLGFYLFSGMEKYIILFSFLIVSIFDSFSQISGQLWGQKKLFPKISPNKTMGGFIGGAIVAILSALLLQNLYPEPTYKLFLLTIGIVVFAFLGDIASSYYKRKYRVKDYNNLIPGHGGFLDRFDSLIAGGAWVAIFQFINF